MNKIVSIDFDGTIVKHLYPEIGEPNQDVIDAIFEEKKNGTKFILWTCRNGKKLEEAVIWCREHDIEFDAINEDLPEIKNTEFGKNKSVKIYADEMWDDRNLDLKYVNKRRYQEAQKLKASLI